MPVNNWKGGISLNKNEYQRKLVQKARKEALNILGGKCIKCGFNDLRALQIDHINAGGSKERKRLNFASITFHKMVMKSFLGNENKYQLLCANCNWIKRVINNERNLC